MPERLKGEKMNFISEDKKTINLPVSLGTIVYKFHTTCNDACLFQKEKFNKIFPPTNGGRCGSDTPCHVILHSIDKIIVNFDNLESMLKTWGISTFETENEARQAGEKLVQKHKQELLKLGLLVNVKESL